MAKLYFRYGTMNSGKSNEILNIRHSYLECGKEVATFKSIIDTRNPGVIYSRAKDLCVKVDLVVGLVADGSMFRFAQQNPVDLILVDECHFLTEAHIDETARIVDELNIPVMHFGLRSDFQTKVFPASKRLFEIADDIRESKTICWCCNRKALFNLRLDPKAQIPVFEGEQVLVGDKDIYRSVCRSCYNLARKTGKFPEIRKRRNGH